MTRTARAAIRLIRGELVRLAAVLCAAAGLTLALGMTFPVQFVLDTAGYRESDAQTTSAIEAPLDSETEVSAGLGGQRVLLHSTMGSALGAGDRWMDDVDVWVLSGDDPDVDLTMMPDSTRVAGERSDTDGNWIDISADVASALDLTPGDRVEVLTGPDSTAPFVVRGVYATRMIATEGLAQVSARALSAHLPGELLAPTALRTTAPPRDVHALLSSPPWHDAMLDGGYTAPFEAVAVDEELARAEEHSVAKFALVLTTSIIAFAALIAIIVSESTAVLRAFRNRADMLVELGASARTTYRAASLAVSAVITTALTAGAAVGTVAFATRFAGPVLPPTLTPVWWIVTAVGVVTGVLVTAALSARQLRKVAR